MLRLDKERVIALAFRQDGSRPLARSLTRAVLLFYLFSPEGPFQCFLTQRNIPDTQTWCGPAGALVWVHSERRRVSKWDGYKASGSQWLHPHCLHFCFFTFFCLGTNSPPFSCLCSRNFTLLPLQPSLLVAKSLMARFPKLGLRAFFCQARQELFGFTGKEDQLRLSEPRTQ